MGATTTYTYDPDPGGLLATITDPNHNTTTYGIPSGLLTDYGYDASGGPTQITDATGVVTSFGYDFLGRVTQSVRAVSTTVSPATNVMMLTSYDLRGNPTSSTDPVGNKTLSCYDLNNNRTARILPASSATLTCSSPGTAGSIGVTTYDPRDLVSATVTNSDSQIRKSVNSYFANGQLSQVTEPLSFNPASGLAQASPQTASYGIFPDNRPQSFVDEVGATTTVVYTPAGLLAQVINPATSGGQHVTATYAYNWQGEPTSTMTSGHASGAYDAYDAFGDKISETDPNGATSTFGYDLDGRMVTSTAAVTGTGVGALTTNAYDANGNLTRLIQPTGHGQFTTVTYTYTVLNQLGSETDPSDPLHVTTFGYDPAGRQVSRTDSYLGATLRTVASSFDPAGRVTATVSTAAGMPGVTATYSYDANSNTTGVTTTESGRASPVVSALGVAYTSANEAKVVTETVSPPTGTAVTKVSTIAYDQDGQVSATTNDGLTALHTFLADGTEASTSASGYGTVASSYFPDGSVSQTSLPGATIRQAYDAAGRLASKVVTGPGGPAIASWSGLAYDQNDQVTQAAVSLTQPAGGTPATLNYPIANAYNARGQLAAARGPTDPSMIAFSPDDAGNLANNQTSVMQYVNNRLVTQTATVSGTVSVFGYDHLGEQVTQITGSAVTTTAYDAAGNPSVITAPDHTSVSFTYDAMGRVASRQDSTGVELDFYGGMSSQVVETTGATGTASVQYLLDSSGQPLAQRSNSPTAGTWASFITDARDNNSALLDTTGAVQASFAYDVFGHVKVTATAQAASGWGSRLKFQMAPQDPKLGLYSLGSRLLDPSIGRFTSADNYVASLADLTLQVDALTGNRYLYASANPAGMFDDGHFGWSSIAKLAKKAIHNSVIRDIAIVAVASAICAGTAGAGCVVIAGAIAGAALKVGDYQVNSAHHSLGGYLGAAGGGAVEGGLVAATAGEGAGVNQALESGGKEVATAAGEEVSTAATGNVSVYQSLDSAGKVQYVGITNDIERRAAEHLAAKGISIDAIPGLENLSRAEARSVEQTLIEKYGLSKNGGTLINKINSIASSNPQYKAALVKGAQILAKSGY